MLFNLFSLLLILLNDVRTRQANVTPVTPRAGICPLKCQCQQATFSMWCHNLTLVEVRHLFGSGGAFPSQFASSIRNLSIVDSELDRLDILPRMERLLALNLSGNQLERAAMESSASLEDALRPAFPSLVILDLSANLITSISRNAFLQLPNVEEIWLSNNRIFSIDWEAFRLFKLRRLFVDQNYLLTINEHMLRYSPSIEELDLSRNQLAVAQSSSFFAAQRLKSLNLSHNRLQRFDYDSFSPLFQLESLDLSHNNFSTIPADLRQFIALRMLNFSGNPITKLAEGELVQPMLQTLDLSHCPGLRLVEQRAFAMTPNLQFLLMANNPALAFFSPLAFPSSNSSLLFELNLANNSLTSLDFRLLEQPTRVQLAHNPLECGCIAEWLPYFADKLVDLERASCRNGEGPAKSSAIPLKALLKKPSLASQCSANPILPLGHAVAGQVGEFFSLYCAHRNGGQQKPEEQARVEWTWANGTELGQPNAMANYGVGTQRLAIESQFGLTAGGRLISAPASSSSGPIRVVHPHGVFSPVLPSPAPPPSALRVLDLDGANSKHQHLLLQRHRFLLSRHLDSAASAGANAEAASMPTQQPRIQAIGEQLRFEILTTEDAGEYGCRVGASPSAVTKLRLTVAAPSIQLSPVEIGSHYVALYWNGSLKIRATERVQLSLQVVDPFSGQIGRIIQLSLHNPWHSYNVVRLRPLTNYTFCLVYSLRQPGGGNIELAKILYKSCVEVCTAEQLGFWSSLSPTAIGILLAICFTLFTLFCFRGIYLRFYIWHEAKMRARMNQSMSGQSFLSRSSSLPQNGTNGCGMVSPSATFDSASGQQQLNNQQQMHAKNGGIGAAGKGKRKKTAAPRKKLSGTGAQLFLFDGHQKEAEEPNTDRAEHIALC